MQIDKNIQMPPRKSRYPWRDIAPGDSFFIEDYGQRQSVATAGAIWFKQHKPDWAIRVSKEGSGFRVFCIEKNG